MPEIDPTSPRQTGTDCHGRPARLGERDSDGVFVGYIEADGDCYEGRFERDVVRGAAACEDAFWRYNLAGGVLGEPPDYRAIVIASGALEENVDEALADFEFWQRLKSVAQSSPLSLVAARCALN